VRNSAFERSLIDYIQQSRAVADKLRDADVKFNKYRNLQQHRAVLAIARLLFHFDCTMHYACSAHYRYLALVHSNSRFESVRFDSLDESIRIDLVSPEIGQFDSTTAWSLYAIFDRDCTVDGTAAAGTKPGKMSVKVSICPPRSPTFHHSTVN